MKVLSSFLRPLGLCSLLFALSACNAPFELKHPPTGFVEVQGDGSYVHYMGADDVGLRIVRFHNPAGGTLDYWARDLTEKLSQRGYTVTASSKVESANRVVGFRYDFDYQPPGSKIVHKYSAILFVSDEHRIVVQLAGTGSATTAARARLNKIAAQIRIRGCKVRSKVCKGLSNGES